MKKPRSRVSTETKVLLGKRKKASGLRGLGNSIEEEEKKDATGPKGVHSQRGGKRSKKIIPDDRTTKSRKRF